MTANPPAQARWTNAFGGVYLLRGQFQAPFEPHMHTRYIVGVVDRGTVVVSRGKRSWAASQGDLIRLPRHEVHHDYGPNGRPWTWRLLYATGEAVRAAVSGVGSAAASPDVLTPVTRNPATAAWFSQLFDAFWSREAPADAPGELSALLGNLFSILPAPSGQSSRDRGMRGIAIVRRHLHQARASEIGIAHLARLAQLSPYHMIRRFRRETGLPPHAYFQQVRVAQAKEMLWQGKTQSAIAFELGFSDQSHFCRDFKRATQITPGQYAAMVRRSGVEWAAHVRRPA